MPLPVGVDTLLSAVQVLLRFRARVDEILALHVTAQGLPFQLPPAPNDDLPHIPGMQKYFQTDEGKLVLELRGRAGQFNDYIQRPNDANVQAVRQKLCALYYEAREITPDVIGPDDPIPAAAHTGPSPEMRLAYYVVESGRLSRNPALTRILLATADTMLEVVGENAGLVIKNPKTRALVETLIDEFAVKRDFDDDSAEMIFKSLLTSTLVAVAEHGDELTDKPALLALFSALGDVREEMGDDFVAGILTREGVQNLLGKYLVHVADDPSFITKHEVAKEALSAMLKEAGNNLPAIVEDPKALLGVLEAGLEVGSSNVDKLLGGKVDNKPLLAALLSSVAARVGEEAAHRQLFAKIANGEVLAGIYKVALKTVADHPGELGTAAKLDPLVAKLVSGAADVLSRQPLADALSEGTLRSVASRAMEILAGNSEELVRDNTFAARLLGDVLEAAAPLVQKGQLTSEDLLALGDQALKMLLEHPALHKEDGTAKDLLGVVAGAISGAGLKGLLSKEGRKALLFDTLDGLAANPVMWKEFKNEELLQPVVQSILKGLRQDPTGLVSGEVLVDSARLLLGAAARRGEKFVSEAVSSDVLEKVVVFALKSAEKEIGKTIDGENLPEFLERVALGFLKSPFALGAGTSKRYKALIKKAVTLVEAA